MFVVLKYHAIVYYPKWASVTAVIVSPNLLIFLFLGHRIVVKNVSYLFAAEMSIQLFLTKTTWRTWAFNLCKNMCVTKEY